MGNQIDPFRPSREPLRSVYDAFQREAEHRHSRSPEEWMAAEQAAVLSEAERTFPQYGLSAPTAADVAEAECRARGHIDYGLQWVCALSQKMQRQRDVIGEKRNYWGPLIGRTVVAKNYRDETATGTLLRVVSGVWGYGGDSVALELDVKDERGCSHWPAGLCALDEQ